MSICVFVGPTIDRAEASRHLAARYLPPAAQGDVYRAALSRPRAIAIVDGLFDQVPAVWHKEILWAMGQGVHVFGASSMGALRAAELAAFGMEGVGAIYAAYAGGELEDDDAVAVAHGPAESGWRPLSEALVNIRATLAAAASQAVIGPATASALEAMARATFYADRGYGRLLDEAAGRGLPPGELAALRAWLPAGRVDQKRADALELLGRLRAWLAEDPAPRRVAFHFEHTIFWERARRGAAPADGPAPQALRAALIEELRLDPPAYQRLRAAALARGLAGALADQQGYAAHPDALRDRVADLRRVRGLERGADYAAWLGERGLSAEALAALMGERAALDWAAAWAVPDIEARLHDELRLDPGYARLEARAAAKQSALAAAGLDEPSLLDAEIERDALLRWFCAERDGAPPPPDLWLYARERGYRDEAALIRAALREYHYARLYSEQPPLRQKEMSA